MSRKQADSIELIELEPQWLRHEIIDGSEYYVPCAEPDAQGIEFLCPACFVENDYEAAGVHSVICWSRARGIGNNIEPGPGRWKWTSDDLRVLSLVGEGGTDSVWLTGKSSCGWHGYIRYGRAELTV